MKNLSFKYKLFLAMSFIVILYASVSVLFVELYLKKILHEESFEDSKAFAATIAENVYHHLQSYDFSEIKTNFRNIMKTNTEIAYIFIQKDDNVLVHTFNSAVPEKLTAVTHKDNEIDFETVTLGENTYSDFSVPIHDSATGTLRVGISERLEKETIRHIMFSLFYITIAVLAAALGISVLLARKLTRPLTMLSASAIEMTKSGLFSSVPVEPNCEIGYLSTVFNKMIQVSKEREDELKEINEELETVNITLHDYIEKLRITTEELVKSRQDMAVIDTARAFLHHIRQPLTYLAMAIDLLTDEISEDNKLNIASVQKKLAVVEDAGKTLSELLRKFDNLKEYKVMLFDDTTKITDIEG
jgi:methyl-accepting chemotaxis protein